MSDYPPRLTRSDIIGQTITDVVGTFEWKGIEDWLDMSVTYLILGNGHAISFPSSLTDDYYQADVPPEAIQFPQETAKKLVGRSIRQVYCEMLDGEPSGDEVILELDDGTFVTECMVAPHGTGQAGLHFLERKTALKRVKSGELQPFWPS